MQVSQVDTVVGAQNMFAVHDICLHSLVTSASGVRSGVVILGRKLVSIALVPRPGLGGHEYLPTTAWRFEQRFY
jgi:hypothetical protein